MLPNLGALNLEAPVGSALVRCPGCASLFQKASPTGCTTCGGKRKREEEKGCGCDDDDAPDPNDPGISEKWKNAFWKANGYSTGMRDLPEEWMVEAAKRKLAKAYGSEGEDAKDCGCDAVEEIVVPNYDDLNDPNMTEEWLTAFWVAKGGREPLGWRTPKRSRMIHAIENKMAREACTCEEECACDEEEDASGPGFFAGVTGDEQDAPFSAGVTGDEQEAPFTSLGNSSKPGFRSLGADDEDAPMPRLGMPSQEEMEEMERARGYMPSLDETEARGEEPKFRAA